MLKQSADITEVSSELCVVGAGMPGICAAIQAARLGVRTVLVEATARPGGNAGAEIGVTVNGATGTNEFNLFSREGGVLAEIMLENEEHNREKSRYVWEGILLDFIAREPNLTLYLSTLIDEAETENGVIASVSGSQCFSEKRFVFKSKFYMDDSGDGTLGRYAGADFHMGREASGEYGESIAPSESDDYVLCSTLYYHARDIGRPVKYTPPSFALDIEKSGILKHRVIPTGCFYQWQWYYELGGVDNIKNSAQILADHRALVYGIWNYVKNSGKYNSVNYLLDFVSCIPGKRESRRLLGDYILTQRDIIETVSHEDDISHGGWSIDLHAELGIYGDDLVNRHYFLRGCYGIPLGCGFSRNITNLFIAGRCMSVSHVALGSTRVIATLSEFAQALGAAAYICLEDGITPREITGEKLVRLKQLLLQNDQMLIHDSLTPRFSQSCSATSSAVLRLDNPASERKVNAGCLYTFPIREKLEAVELFLRGDEDCRVKYTLFTSKHPSGYSPDLPQCSGSFRLERSERLQRIRLDFTSVIEGGRYVMLELRPDKPIWQGTAAEELPAIANHLLTGSGDTLYDAVTEQVKREIWSKTTSSACFIPYPEQRVYEAENLLDGCIRPGESTHMWRSGEGDANPAATITFEKRRVSSLDIYFDASFTDDYSNHFQAQPAVSKIVRDFDVILTNGGESAVIARKRGNYQRHVRLELGGKEADGVRLELISPSGTKQFSVYGLYLR